MDSLREIENGLREYSTACGHSVIITSVRKKGGRHEGKWRIVVAGLFLSDSSAALHCVTKEGVILTHQVSWDGGENWTNQTYNLTRVADSIEEWEFHANGEHDLFVLNVRYQSAVGPDIDVAWHVRGYSESLEPDALTYLGQDNLDSTSGAGNDIRFDFASMGIMADGGAFIAYHDATDPDPLFGLEMFHPYSN